MTMSCPRCTSPSQTANGPMDNTLQSQTTCTGGHNHSSCMTSISGGKMLKDAISLSSCKVPNATLSPVMHMINLVTRVFTPCYVPFLIIFGGLCLLMMLGGTSNHAMSAKSTRWQKSRSHPPSPHQRPSSVKPTLTSKSNGNSRWCS